jgi:hypothetical protein
MTVKITKNGRTEVRPTTSSGRLAKAPTEKQLRYLAKLWSQLGNQQSQMPDTRQGAFLEIRRAQRKLEATVPTTAVQEPGPTEAQLHDLAVLARRLQVAIPSPSTRGEAAGQLHRLRRLAEAA